MRGASITAPFKVALMSKVDEIDRAGATASAPSTRIVVRDGRWIGANTDVDGFLAPLAGRMALKGTRASMLGAGGAARAVAVALADEGAAVTICARRAEAARDDRRPRRRQRRARCRRRPGSWDVLVNATSAGSAARGTNPIDGAPLDGEIVFDLVYAPAEHRCSRGAARRAA